MSKWLTVATKLSKPSMDRISTAARSSSTKLARVRIALAEAVAAAVGGRAVQADITDAASMAAAVAATVRVAGPGLPISGIAAR